MTDIITDLYGPECALDDCHNTACEGSEFCRQHEEEFQKTDTQDDEWWAQERRGDGHA